MIQSFGSLLTLIGMVIFFHTFIDPLSKCYRTFLKIHCRNYNLDTNRINPIEFNAKLKKNK